VKSSRLLSILLLLQTRGRTTAAQLAAELDVSVRTVYRDIESLTAAGVPLYADAGHSGGYRLIDGYRTRLTGLSAGEAEALFLSGIPGPATELGLGGALAAARLKLRAALPPELRAQADRMRSRFHLDAPGWYAEDDDVPHLRRVADAVWESRVLEVRYRRWKEPTDVDRRLEPYGLVLKAGRWYVVAGPGPRTYRVDQILELTECDERFEAPADFDLAGHWQRYQADFLARLHRDEAVVRLAGRGRSHGGGGPGAGRDRHRGGGRLDQGGAARRVARSRTRLLPRDGHRRRGPRAGGTAVPPRGHVPRAGSAVRVGVMSSWWPWRSLLHGRCCSVRW
jgi:predicted DNA-binding transcriptional regulator YafY